MPNHLPTPDPLEALRRIEARAAQAMKDLDNGGAKNGRSALSTIKEVAGDSRRYALEAQAAARAAEQDA